MAVTLKSLGDPALVKSLNNGGVGILPTDTVYGLVCVASNPNSVERLYRLKDRKNKPGTLIAANLEQLSELGIKRSYVKAVEQFWPGPVSVVVPFSDRAGNYLRQGKTDIAVRLPDDKQLVELLSKTGALMTTSANKAKSAPAETIKMAKEFFGEDVDFYADGGDLSGRQASTIIKVIDDAVEVLRQGAVIIKNNSVV